jgi:predicted enzyme related to lactoylglutathione lyase
MITGVDVTFIHSPDRSLADWFLEKLELTKSYDDGHWIEFESKDGSRFAIDVVASQPSEVERQPIMISFRVADINKVVRKLAEKGIEFYPSVGDAIFDVGSALVATFKDAQGNWHQISQSKT